MFSNADFPELIFIIIGIINSTMLFVNILNFNALFKAYRNMKKNECIRSVPKFMHPFGQQQASGGNVYQPAGAMKMTPAPVPENDYELVDVRPKLNQNSMGCDLYEEIRARTNKMRATAEIIYDKANDM